MRTLVVLAYPEPLSFNGAMFCTAAEEWLRIVLVSRVNRPEK